MLALLCEASCYLGLFACATGMVESSWQLGALFMLASAVSAAKFVVLFTLMMGWSTGTQAGVDFSLLQSADMTLAIVTAIAGGWLVSLAGYSVHFGLAALITLVALLAALSLLRNHSSLTPNRTEASASH